MPRSRSTAGAARAAVSATTAGEKSGSSPRSIMTRRAMALRSCRCRCIAVGPSICAGAPSAGVPITRVQGRAEALLALDDLLIREGAAVPRARPPHLGRVGKIEGQLEIGPETFDVARRRAALVGHVARLLRREPRPGDHVGVQSEKVDPGDVWKDLSHQTDAHGGEHTG